MEYSSQYNKAQSRDFEDDPYFNEEDVSNQKHNAVLLKPNNIKIDDARKLNESIFNRIPSNREEQK
jgi:hypothetical protein